MPGLVQTLLPVAGATTSVVVTSDTISIAIYAEVNIDPVTKEVREAFQIAGCVILCGIISLFGIVSNIITVSVFVKQGFKDTINISLLGLAISDFCCTLFMFWGSMFYNPLFHKLDLPIAPLDVMYVSSALPHVCFNRITSFITAFVTLERCLCIAMPLKVNTIITPFRTKVIIVFIFISMIILFCPFYFVNKLKWKFSVARNRSILAISFARGREKVDSITFFSHSVLLSTGLLLCVFICTIILVVKLKETTKWRKKSFAQNVSTKETASVKEKKVVKMVILISTIFIACYIPPTINFIIMAFDPEFSITGRLQNILYAIWSLTFALEAFNSSVNIFVYYKMSSKFKETLNEIFFGVRKK